MMQIEQPIAPLRSTGDDNPFIAFRRYLAWDAFAAALGMSDDARVSLIRAADSAVQRVSGTGFRFTPFARHDALSNARGFSSGGGVWVKDETQGVAGSHKSQPSSPHQKFSSRSTPFGTYLPIIDQTETL